MAKRFISKHSNYMIVLRPGVEGNRALGTHAISGLYVNFLDGVVDVKEESIIELLLAHPGFGTDFVEVKDDEVDPYLSERTETEPGHVTTEIKYGYAGKKTVSALKTKLTPQMRKIVEVEAVKMIPDILKSNPKILKDIILDLAAGMKKDETEQAEEPQTTEEKNLKNTPKSK